MINLETITSADDLLAHVSRLGFIVEKVLDDHTLYQIAKNDPKIPCCLLYARDNPILNATVALSIIRNSLVVWYVDQVNFWFVEDVRIASNISEDDLRRAILQAGSLASTESV